ncbi:MAG: B12-binding domain-containing radical SAM protein [Clostridia bacterium]|nr:B12-binding domain-containing radical SAM protein [Clostridia bacterium]
MKSVLLFNVKRAMAGPSNDCSDYMGAFYLAAVLEERGYDPWVFHGYAHEVPEILAREVSYRNIAVIGFACDFENRSVVEELSLFVKEKYRIPVVVGGPQAMDLKEDFFRKSRCDYVVRGEGEHTLPQLIGFIVKHEGSREDIKGITWLDDSAGIVSNADNEPVSDLDTLPLPAYHRSLHTGRTYGRSIFTGRGCPFSCAFCYESNHKKRVRLRSMDKVMEEIKHNLDTYPELNYIIVSDDTFTLSTERVQAFCKGIKILRSGRDFVWYCEGHVHLLAKWPGMMRLMAESGLARLQIGVETGCQNVLDLYRKQVTLDEIEFVIEEAVKVGVPQIATNLIIGGPAECEKTIGETEAFAERLLRKAPGVIDILTGFLRPYPGTAIAENPEAFKLAISDPQGAKSFDDYPLIEANGMTLEDILKYRVRISRHIFRVMNEITDKGLVPYKTILSQYKSAMKYGITSMWYTEIFKKNHFLDEYFRMIAKGAAVRFEDVPQDELMRWRPQRTVEIRRAVNFEQGFPKIGGYVLSPLEFELLLRCSAKLRFEEVLEDMYSTFGERYEGMEAFKGSVIETFRKFDKMYWLVFCKV